MKIAFDARMITHPGIGTYIKSLLPEMIKQSPLDEFIVLGDPDVLNKFSWSKDAQIRPWTIPIYSVLEQILPFYLAGEVDVLHIPHFNIPLFYRGKMVVTVHDLIYLLFPQSVPSPFAAHYARHMIRKSLKKAGKVIAVSNHTKKDLLGIFQDTEDSKIQVIHEAPGHEFERIEDKAKLADVRTRYRISEDFILFVGSVKPHKNLSTLLKVFNLLKGWGLAHQLVICGRWDKKEDHLKGELEDRNIRYLGEVSTSDLSALYSMAELLVHLSLYEGFGLTVLEAIKCGTPVVVSASSSLPEVVGNAAFVVPPDDVPHIADTIFNILMNKKISEGMVEAGFKHLKNFSWEHTAKKTLEVYRSI
jgi:glycosyltransferase involved in cell wall biosynthesis